jgi:hypothetical protein
LNVDNENPTTCLNAGLQAIKDYSPRLKREDIMASFFNKFEVLFEIFSNQGILGLITPINDHTHVRLVAVDFCTLMFLFDVRHNLSALYCRGKTCLV